MADGHHRTAAAARVGAEKREGNPNHTGQEEYNYFMTVCFPESQLKIIDYNRVVKDLNGLSPEQFIEALGKDFDVKPYDGEGEYRPSHLHNFAMYLEGKWYSLEAKAGRYDDKDPIGVLDVTILSNLVLDKILGIKDLRTDKRIDFVGGIRGLGELSRRVDNGEVKVAFAALSCFHEAAHRHRRPAATSCLLRPHGSSRSSVPVSQSISWTDLLACFRVMFIDSVRVCVLPALTFFLWLLFIVTKFGR